MIMKKKSKRSKTSDNKSEIALDLRNCSEKYSGLEVSKSDLSDSRNKGICGTIMIPAWVHPDGSNMTLLRLDFPEMGFVRYKEGPHEK